MIYDIIAILIMVLSMLMIVCLVGLALFIITKACSIGFSVRDIVKDVKEKPWQKPIIPGLPDTEEKEDYDIQDF